MALAELARFHNLPAAHLAHGALAAAGIPSLLLDTNMAGLTGGGFAARLMVDEGNLLRARTMLIADGLS